MYKYRNTKTGMVILTSNKVSGTKWEEILPDEQVPDQPDDGKTPDEQAPAKPAKKGKKK